MLAASYTLIPIPNIDTPNAINVHGHVVGSNGDTLSAVFWDGVTLTTIGPGTALALNNSDMAVGFDNLIGQSGANSNAWYWTLAKGKQYLPTPPGATETAAVGINTDGAIVGTAFVPGVGGSVIYWSSPTAVPVPLAKLPDGSLPNPIAISDSGVIAGSDGYWPSPTSAPVLLNSLGQNPAIAYVQVNAVDSAGNLYGVATSVGGFRHSMEWKAGSTTPTDLTPGDTTSLTQALAVNSVGTVVGIPGAFSGGKAILLGPRITNLGNLVIQKATGINGCGQIIVIATNSPSPLASPGGYLLSPQ